MSKQLLTLGIVLSLGTVGCAAVGQQQGSSLSAQAQTERGLDSLWSSAEREPSQGLRTTRYAERELGELWGGGSEVPEEVGVVAFPATPQGGDLWNSAAVARTWEVQAVAAQRPSGRLTLGEASRNRRGSRRGVAQ